MWKIIWHYDDSRQQVWHNGNSFDEKIGRGRINWRFYWCKDGENVMPACQWRYGWKENMKWDQLYNTFNLSVREVPPDYNIHGIIKRAALGADDDLHQLNESKFCCIHSSSLDSWFLYYWRRTTYDIVLNFIYSCQTGGVAEFWKILPQPQVAKKAVFTYTWAWDGHHWRE